ncbi:hypothetical protein LZ31DRAFT_206904 [Colletotrichum somersetense]|nr:hypothetical protein LZ31DRAFT_206904 [Colletotrichum somersetense]
MTEGKQDTYFSLFLLLFPTWPAASRGPRLQSLSSLFLSISLPFSFLFFIASVIWTAAFVISLIRFSLPPLPDAGYMTFCFFFLYSTTIGGEGKDRNRGFIFSFWLGAFMVIFSL